jgi:pimeloyl-ACP methyl ester carboxylesterase
MRSITDGSISTFSFGGPDGSGVRKCKVAHIGASRIMNRRIDLEGSRILLLLAGTSLTFSDTMELIIFLTDAGYGLAAIENRTGGLFSLGINPKIERLEVLQSYIEYLQKQHGVKGIDIIAHSYAAFEVVRLLSSHPVKYNDFVKSVIFVNPAGFNRKNRIWTHCSRFIFGHVLNAYIRRLQLLLGIRGFGFKKSDPAGKQYIYRDFHGANRWTLISIKNPARSIKELVDIVTFDLVVPLKMLQDKYNYNFNLFLQSDDELLPIKFTLKQAQRIIPDNKIKIVPGRHNDIFFQQDQRGNLLEFIQQIRGMR